MAYKDRLYSAVCFSKGIGVWSSDDLAVLQRAAVSQAFSKQVKDGTTCRSLKCAALRITKRPGFGCVSHLQSPVSASASGLLAAKPLSAMGVARGSLPNSVVTSCKR